MRSLDIRNKIQDLSTRFLQISGIIQNSIQNRRNNVPTSYEKDSLNTGIRTNFNTIRITKKKQELDLKSIGIRYRLCRNKNQAKILILTIWILFLGSSSAHPLLRLLRAHFQCDPVVEYRPFSHIAHCALVNEASSKQQLHQHQGNIHKTNKQIVQITQLVQQSFRKLQAVILGFFIFSLFLNRFSKASARQNSDEAFFEPSQITNFEWFE